MSGVAIVTGASRGIGRAIAIRLVQDGFKVALNDLPSQKEALEELRAEVSNDSTKATIFFADVSSEEEVKAMIAEVVRTMGGLDVMVANAGICIVDIKEITEIAAEDFLRTLSVNTLGTFFCYKHAAKQMIKQGRGGRIIGAASVASKQGLPSLLTYCSSKFAVRGLTQSAALDLGKYGITVNAYAPGAIDTAMLQNIRDVRGTTGQPVTTPIARLGTPEDIAGLVSYLASKDAGMVTGQSISINGGMLFD